MIQTNNPIKNLLSNHFYHSHSITNKTRTKKYCSCCNKYVQPGQQNMIVYIGGDKIECDKFNICETCMETYKNEIQEMVERKYDYDYGLITNLP